MNYIPNFKQKRIETKLRPTRGWNRPGLRPGGNAHRVFDGAYCILNLDRHSRPGGSTANRWAANQDEGCRENNYL